MSSFPISITWQVAAPPTGTFTQLASSVSSLDAALQASGQKFDQFGQTITQLESPLSSVGTNMGALSNNMSELDSSLGTSASNMQGFADATGQMATEVEGSGSSLVNLGGAIGEVSTSSSEASGTVSEFGGSMNEANGSATELGGSTTELGGSIGELSSRVQDANQPMQEMNTIATEAGPIFTGAGTATTEFTGALTGMNTENLAAATGLTDTNTLVGDLGVTTEDTSDKTVGFKENLATLGVGIAGVVSTGMLLFNAFTSIRDAQLKVDAANLRVDKSMTSLEGKMSKLSETTNKMNSDQTLMISGLGEWNTAFSELQGLMDQGITSGEQWDAALRNAQVAQQGLTSSTSEGNAVIGEAKTQLDKAGQGAEQLSINQGKAQKASEGLWKAAGELALTFTSLGGNMTTTIKGLKDVHANFLKGGVSGSGFGKVLGVIGPVAIAVGTALLVLNEATKALNITNQDTVIKFEDAKKAIDGVNETMRGWISQIPGIGPLIAGVNKELENQINGLTGVTQATDKDTASKGPLQQALGGVFDKINEMTGGLLGEVDASNKAAEGTKLLSTQFTDLGVGSGIVVNGVKQAEGSFTRLSDGSVVLGGTLSDTNATMTESGTTAEDTSNHLITYGEAVAQAKDELAKQGVESENTHQKNLALLELWGVKFPPALRGNEAAIQGLVTAYQDQQGATAKVVTEATAYIQAHGDINNVVDTSANGIVAYAESLGFESEAAMDAAAANEEFKAKLEEGKAALDEAGKATYELTKAVSEGGAETVAATETRRQDAIALGVYDEMIQLAVQDQDKFVESKKSEAAALRESAVARGLDKASTEENIQVLQTYIQTHERLPPTIEEANAAYTDLLVAKQDEAHETELSRIALEAYLTQQMGVPGVVGESIQVLQALDAALVSMAAAYEEGRASIISWVAELASAEEKERGALDQLQPLVDVLKTEFPEAVNMSSEEVMRLTERLLESGQGWEDWKNKVKEGVDAAAEAAEESTGMMVDALHRVGDAIGGDEWKEDLSEWEDDLDGSLAGMTIAVDETFGTDIPNILAQFAGSPEMQFTEVKNHLAELKDQIDMSPAVWEESFGEIEAILNNAALTVGEKMALIESDIAGLWDRAKPKIMAGAGVLTDELANFLKSNTLPAIEKALSSKDPTAALLQYFEGLPPATRDQMDLFTGILKTAGGDVQKAITTIVGILQSKDIAIPESTINAMASAFNVPAATIKAKIAEMSGNIKTLPTDTQTAADQTGAAMGTLPPTVDQHLMTFAQSLNFFATTFMPAWVADVKTNGIDPLTLEFGRLPGEAGLHILTLSTALNTFATGFMTTLVSDITTNGINPIILEFERLKVEAGQHILDFSTALNTFGTTFMTTLVSDITANGINPIILEFERLKVEAGQQILELGNILNTFAVDFIQKLAKDIQTNLGAAVTAFTNFKTQAGAQILALGQAMNTFATSFMSAFARDVTSNISRAVAGFTNFRTQAGAQIMALAQALNTFASAFMSAFARDIGTHLSTAQSRFAAFASAVRGSMSQLQSSVSSAIASVRQLQAQINALKSKTITITTRYVTVGRPGFARGGSFVTNSPTKVAGASVSEFGHAELVTVTPLQTPGREPVKGLADLLGKETEKKGRRALDAEREAAPTKGKKEVVMMRETPIIIQIDGREITRVVNKRIFEGADALT